MLYFCGFGFNKYSFLHIKYAQVFSKLLSSMFLNLMEKSKICYICNTYLFFIINADLFTDNVCRKTFDRQKKKKKLKK